MVTTPNAGASRTFLQDVQRGFEQSPKQLPSKYFYDAQGSTLFDAICELPEYYPTRTEIGIMSTHGEAIAQAIGPKAVVIEYGSGSGEKTHYLLKALQAPKGYIPVEISETALSASVKRLRLAFPQIRIESTCADYTQPFELPKLATSQGQKRIIFFPGSTIGNFPPERAQAFLELMRSQVGEDGGVLIGVDMRKDPAILHDAYNDAAGITAQFNKNIIARINRELDTSIDLDAIHHYAPYNPVEGRIEMYLYNSRDQEVTLGEENFVWKAGESILTEYSYKYSLDGFSMLARKAGFSLQESWSDQAQLFSVLYLVPV